MTDIELIVPDTLEALRERVRAILDREFVGYDGSGASMFEALQIAIGDGRTPDAGTVLD